MTVSSRGDPLRGSRFAVKIAGFATLPDDERGERRVVEAVRLDDGPPEPPASRRPSPWSAS